ncbi:MAG: DNA recombination protein RmuC, partial [Gammaproteobacteria bacterium]
MEAIVSWLAVAISGLSLIVLFVILKKLGGDKGALLGKVVREEFRVSRNEAAVEARSLREEVSRTQKAANDTVVRTIAELGKSQQEGIGAVETRVKSLVESNEARLDKLRETIEMQMRAIQGGNESRITEMKGAVTKTIDDMKKSQHEDLGLVERRVKSIAESNEIRLDKLRETVDRQMQSLQENNEKKLDQMRQTVDEKLHNTLEKRLGESFRLVSERLEAVQRGLGDMQNLATGVGDLKRMLTNVKARGTWGEFQIGDILEQILTPDQYERNVQP